MRRNVAPKATRRVTREAARSAAPATELRSLRRRASGSDVRRLPVPNPKHSVGTKEFPYKVHLPKRARMRAILEGVRQLSKSMSTREAVRKKARRLLLIRTLHKHTKHCALIHRDVLSLYQRFGMDKTGVSNICKSRAS